MFFLKLFLLSSSLIIKKKIKHGNLLLHGYSYSGQLINRSSHNFMMDPKKEKTERETKNLISKEYDIIKADEDSRLYRGLELTNGMKILLVSDTSTDKSAAALNVLVGSMSDPRDLPGLSHFCEHMLFLGTKKYPAENEYNKFLHEHGGSSNAFTSYESTCYFFDVSPNSFKDALDRFAQFFLHPLFTESAVEREVNAVDSEHEKNILLDSWRLTQLERCTSNPGHDFSKFGTGNLDTLYNIPKSKGINIRDELLKFHEKLYSSNLMALVVYGKENLEELTEMVVPLFSEVVNKNLAIPKWEEHPFDSEHLKLQGYVLPVKEMRTLTVTFPTPDLQDKYRCCPGKFGGHLIGHEGPGSLLSELKKRGWTNGLSAGLKVGGKGFGVFAVDFALTEEGLDHTDEIITLLFQYLKMVKEEGIQEWIFQECKMIGSLSFRFRDVEKPQTFTQTTASRMTDFPMEEVLCGPFLLYDFEPKFIYELFDMLIPDRIRIAVVSKRYENICTETEKWYGTKYKLAAIKEETLEHWRNVKPHPNMKLPPRNELIPTNLNIIPRDLENTKYPILLKNTKMGRLWFKQDDKFLLPKAVLQFEIESPLTYVDPLHFNMSNLYVLLVKDALNEYAYAAELAGLFWNIGNTKLGIFICIRGFNDKQHVLLHKIMEKLTSLQIDKKRFEILKAELKRCLNNFRAEQPHRHAIYYTSMLLTERCWINDELLNCIDEITIEGLQEMIPRLFAKVHIEALIHGNLNRKQAVDLMNIVENILKQNRNSKYLMPSQFSREREIQLSDGCHYVYEIMNEVHTSSAIETYYQCGIQDTRANMLLELLIEIINEPCFTYLRTQEQLGYIVSSGIRRLNGTQGLRIVVQSDKPPSFIDSKIESFVQIFDKHIQDLTNEEYENYVGALASIHLETPKKLVMESAKYWLEISSRQYNFDRDAIEVDCLKTISREELYSFFKEMIACDAPKRKKLSVHVIPSTSKSTSEEVDGQYPCIPDESASNDGLIPPPPGFRPPVKIENVIQFKNSLALYPLVPPWIPIPSPFLSVSEKSKL